MVRDHVSIVGGDWNQAYHLLPEVIKSLQSTGQPTARFDIFEARGPEVCVVLLQYKSEESFFAEPRHGLADPPSFGLRDSDTSCHYPLLVCILPGHLRGAPGAALHQRLAATKALRRKPQEGACILRCIR